MLAGLRDENGNLRFNENVCVCQKLINLFFAVYGHQDADRDIKAPWGD
jgi:hypothetical protein